MNQRISLAVASIRRGDFNAGLTQLTEALDQEPGNAQARGRRAWLLAGMGRYEEALLDYRRLLEANSLDCEAMFRCAETLAKLGRPEEAIETLQQLLRCNPLDRNALALWQSCTAELRPEPPAAANPKHAFSGQGAAQINPVLQKMEQTPGMFPFSVSPHTGRLLYSVVRSIAPRVAVETGCFAGYSTVFIAQALEDNQAGRLHSFDLFHGNESPAAGEAYDPLEAARARLEEAGLAHRVIFHKGDSSTGVSKQFAAKGDAIDFAFIDGDHTLRGCFKDWEAIYRHLAPDSVVALHDTMPDACGCWGPYGLLKELARRRHGTEQVNLATPDQFGLALIKITAPKRNRAWKPSLLERWRERNAMRRPHE